MARHALDLDFFVPTALHDPRQAHGIVAVALIDLHRQRRLGVTGINADHRQAERSELMPKPSRSRAGLKANALRVCRLCLDKRGNRDGFRDYRAFTQNLAIVIDHADRRLFERHIQTNINFHNCSPALSLHPDRHMPVVTTLRRAAPSLGQARSKPRVTPC